MKEVKVGSRFEFDRAGWVWTPLVDIYWGRPARPYRLVITFPSNKEIRIGGKK